MSFTCPLCGTVSHNPHDAVERYCGRCHVFVDEVMTMTDDDLRQLMTECVDRLKSVYPFPPESNADPRLAFAIGCAVGVLSEGLDAQREDRPVRVNLAGAPAAVRTRGP